MFNSAVTGPATDNAVGVDIIRDQMGVPAFNALTDGIGLGEIGVHGHGDHLAIVTYANGCYLAHQAVEHAFFRTVDEVFLSIVKIIDNVARCYGKR